MAGSGEEEIENLRKRISVFYDAVGDSTKSFTSALVDGKEGLSKYNKAIDQATSGTAGLLDGFGLLGKTAGLLVKAFGALTGAALKQQDAIIKLYRNMSDVGAIQSGGIDKLQKQINSILLTSSEDAEVFAAAIRKSSKELALLGGNVAAGQNIVIDSIADMFDPKNNSLLQSFYSMGMTVDTVRESLITYAASQAKAGTLQGKSVTDITKAYTSYIGMINEVTQLTGLNRDEVQKEIEARQMDYRWNQYKLTLNEEERLNAERSMTAFSSRFGTEFATGLKELILTKGVPITKAGIDVLLATNGQILDSFNLTVKNNDLLAREQIKTGRNIKIYGDQFSDITAYTQDIPGYTNAMLNGAHTLHNISEDQLKAQNEKATADAKIRAQNDLDIKAKRNAAGKDAILAEVGGTLVNVFQSLVRVGNSFAKFMAKVVDKLSPKILGKQTNLSALLRDEEDVAEDLATAQRHVVNTTEQLAMAQKELSLLTKDNIKFTSTEIQAKQDLLAQQKKAVLRESDGDKKAELRRIAIETERELRMMERSGLKGKMRDERLIELASDIDNLLQLKTSQDTNISALIKEKEKYSGVSNTSTSSGTPLIKWGGNTGSAENFSKLSPDSQRKFNDMIQEYSKSAGFKPVTVTSAHRDYAEATRLYDTWVKSGGDYKNNPTVGGITSPVKPDPNRLDSHGQGRALDIDKESFNSLLQGGYLKKYGFSTVDGDPGHIQLPQGRSGGLFRGPTSGYNVRLHGNEIVVPMPSTGGLSGNINKTDLSKYTSGTSNSDLSDRMGMLMDNVVDMVDYLRRSVDAQEKLLQVARN